MTANIFFFFLMTAVATGCPNVKASLKLSPLKERYPFNLRTDDYGILNTRDLESYVGSFSKGPVEAGKSFAFRSWQCFPVRNVTGHCKDMGHEPGEEAISEGSISVDLERERLEFIFRRAVSTEICEDFLKHWKALMEDQQYACLAGEYIESEESKGSRIAFWVFDRLKTKVGCSSYALGQCPRGLSRSFAIRK